MALDQQGSGVAVSWGVLSAQTSVRTVTLENELVSVVVLPDKGADVYALRYKPHGDLDVLWKAPWGQRTPGTVLNCPATSEMAWMDYYGGGWQDILPSGGGPCIYQGVEMPFHGEVSMLPWECAVVSTGPTLAEIALRVRTHRLPLAVRRTIAVEVGVPALRVHEQITNEGGDDIELMWGQHLAFGAPFLSDHCWLDIPATTFLAHDPALGPTSRLRGGDRFAWPHGARDHAGRSLELRRVPAPSQAVADYGYLLDLRDGWYTLYNEELDLGVRVSWPSEVFSCVVVARTARVEWLPVASPLLCDGRRAVYKPPWQRPDLGDQGRHGPTPRRRRHPERGVQRRLLRARRPTTSLTPVSLSGPD